MKLLTLLIGSILSIAACSPEDSKTPKVAGGVLAEDSRLALDSAKAVQATAQDAADQAKQEIDAQSQ